MLLPNDEYNQQLIHQVHPIDWINPTPVDRYDLVVIGAGTAGLVVAAGAAGLGIGLRVALIEKHLMGGDCLNYGCVPSKAILRSARAIAEVKRSRQFGITGIDTATIDFAAVMERMRQLRSAISYHDSAARFRDLGVDVFLGAAQFVDRHTITVENQTLRFKKAVIATGARAAIPDVPGLQAAGYLTNETIFSLTELPKRLAIVGGGPIGCELAQAMQRFGCQVILLHKHSHLLDREDPEAAAIVQQALIQDGVQLHLEAQLQRVEIIQDASSGNSTSSTTQKQLHFAIQGTSQTIIVDEILIAAGRTPNVEGLNLEAAEIAYDRTRGIHVNDFLQTSQPHIYAAGDICMDWKYTHAADAAARIVIKNALFSPGGLGRSKLSDLIMPRVTYTDPELAHVGLDPHQAQTQGIATQTVTTPLDRVDRAILDSETEGFVKILYRQGSDEILGATIVGRHAGDWISEITLAIVGKQGLNTLSTVIHPYPTQADSLKKAADSYRRTLLTPRSQQFLKWLAQISLTIG